MVRALRYERVANNHIWWRIAGSSWNDPLNSNFAKEAGGRWNPPNSFRTLYLNGDKKTARCNLKAFTARLPYEPEDLRDDNGPVLIGCRLPREQNVCDVHTADGVRDACLPDTYPFELDGAIVSHSKCQEIGKRVKDESGRGVHARSAKSSSAEDLELAWFPASSRSAARAIERLSFNAWYWHS